MNRPFQVIDNRQLDTLRVFHEVARALTSTLDLPAILHTIMSKMEEFFGPEQWSLLLMDEKKSELYFALHAGSDETGLRDSRIKVGEGFAGRAAESGKTQVVDIQSSESAKQFAAAHPQLNLQSLICMPILRGDRVLGVLQLYNSKADRLAENSVSFLRVLCDYTAIALQNAEQMELIQQLSITDDCTSLFNGRHLYEMLEAEIGRRDGPRTFSLLFFDLDHFKSINDTHGHLAGSRLLAEVGALIKRSLGTDHAGFRYGGDEFVALLRGLNRPATVELANTLRDALNETVYLRSQKLAVRMTASFGLACFPEDGDTLQGIIHAADSMMYHAKEQGRDRIVVASGNLAEMPPRRHSRHEWESLSAVSEV